jgi:hypothetical protein
MCGSRDSSVRLPPLILARICIVGDPSNRQAREVIHKASRFEVEIMGAQFLCQPIPGGTVLYHRIT